MPTYDNFKYWGYFCHSFNPNCAGPVYVCKDMNNQDKYTYTVDEVIKRFFKKEKGELTRRNFPKYGGQVDNNKEENSGTDCSSLKSKAFLTANKAFCSVLRITSPLANFYTKIC